MNRFFLFIALVFFCGTVGLFGGGYVWYQGVCQPSVQLSQPVEVIIPNGMTMRGIAMLLKESGVIRSAFLFRSWSAWYGVDTRLKPGKYKFSGNESYEQIFFVLMKGNEEFVRVTIPEGWTISRISERIEAEGICSSASFSQAVFSRVLLSKIFSDWGEIESPEGLVFPETYTFSKGVTPEKVAEVMLSLTHETVNKAFDPQRITPLGIYKSCILASIVECEAKLNNERPLIASVFYNRLTKGMNLESCATVQYAFGERKERLTFEDLKIVSPFNTYNVSGLPPTPISNFGRNSLAAVASPATSDFLFFVSNASGGHFFSTNLSQHERSRKHFFSLRRKTKER